MARGAHLLSSTWTHSLTFLVSSAVVVAGARETLEKIEASNVKLRELCAKRGISV